MKTSLVQTPIQTDLFPIITGIHYQTEFIQFAIWCGTPRQSRKFQTQKEFANSIKVHQDILADWKKHPQFLPLVSKVLNEWVKDRISDAVGSLYEKICSDKVSAADVKLFFQLGGIDIINPNNK